MLADFAVMTLPPGAHFASHRQTVAQTACVIMSTAIGAKEQVRKVADAFANLTAGIGADFVGLVSVFGCAQDGTGVRVLK